MFENLMDKGSSRVEQWTENPRVGGSNPPPGATITKQKLSIRVKSTANFNLTSISYKSIL